MAEMLSTQYSSVFSEPKQEMEDPEDLFPDGNYSESWIHNVTFDQEDIVTVPDLGLGTLGTCPGASTRKGLHKSRH